LFFSTTSVWCQTTYYSKAIATDFASTASWGTVADGSGTAPSSMSGNIFIIANGSVMNLNANASILRLTINSGSLTINSNSLTLSNAANNTYLGVNTGGLLTISGGSVSVNGYAFFADGSSLTQSGGLFSLDPNTGSGGVGNVPTFGIGYAVGGAASQILAANVSKFSLTGGTLRLVDPPFNSSASALVANLATSSYINFGSGHTLELGDGSSTTAGGNTLGFNIQSTVSTTGRLAYGNLTINTVTTASNRHVNLSTNSGFSGNVVINSGSELRGTARLSIAGNLTNNGTLVIPASTSLAFEQYQSASSTAVTVAQSVSGSGTFKNATTGETAMCTNLIISNSSTATGVSFDNSIAEFTVSGTVNLGGIVTMGTGTNTLTCGISAGSLGTFTYNSGRVIGKIKKWVGTTSPVTYTFPIGTSAALRTSTVQFTGAPTTAGELTVGFNASTPGSRNLPTTLSGQTIDAISPTGYWTIISTVAGGTYTAGFNASGFTKVNGSTAIGTGDLSGIRLIKGGSNSGNYTDAETTAPGSLNGISIAGQMTFSDFAIGGTGIVLPVEFQSITAFSKGKANSINWVTASEQDVQAFGIERSVDNQTWVQIGTTKATGGSTTTAYTFTDEAPLPLNYYRIRSIENSGKDQFSKIVSVKRSNEKLSLAAVYPMPITEGVTLDVVSHKAGKVLVSITDIVGRVVKTDYFMVEEGSNTRPLNLTQLAKGTYILNLTNGEVHINQRIVKQ
jgi:hypothetical protein